MKAEACAHTTQISGFGQISTYNLITSQNRASYYLTKQTTQNTTTNQEIHHSLKKEKLFQPSGERFKQRPHIYFVSVTKEG